VTFIIVIFGVLFLIRTLLNKFYGTIDRNNEIDIKGKIVLVTGANAGIGRQTVLELAKRGAHVILACRDLSRANDAIDWIRKQTSRGQMVAMRLDLACLESVRNFAAQFNRKYERLDILINNGAVMLNPEKRLKTSDGFEIHFGVNHLGHFLLTKLLLDKLRKAAPSRIVTVSAVAISHGSVERMLACGDATKEQTYERGNTFLDKISFEQIGPGNKPYSDSKLANALFSKELAMRLEGTGVRTYALCPGIVSTGLADSLDIPKPVFAVLKYILKFILKTPEQGCWTTLYCALSRDLVNESGQMYQNCRFWDPKARIPLTDADAKKLWDLSEKLVGIIPP